MYPRVSRIYQKWQPKIGSLVVRLRAISLLLSPSDEDLGYGKAIRMHGRQIEISENVQFCNTCGRV